MAKRRWIGLGSVVVGMAMAIACASSGDGGAGRDCASGATRACTCEGGAAGSQVCSSDGYWRACSCGSCSVTPTCDGKACGADDGCGNACLVGTCSAGEKCNNGRCSSAVCVPECAGKACGAPDLCGGVCTSGMCAKAGYSCVAGKCECKPVCTTCGGDDTCGGKCMTGACAQSGYKCTSGTCAVDPTSRWNITIKTGKVTNNSWNSFSAPDAMVCLWIDGKRTCTQDSGDTMAPVWNCTLGPVAASVLAAGIAVEIFDNDLSSSGTCGWTLDTPPGEAICTKGTVTVKPSDFASRTWGASCAEGSFSATLTPAP